MWSVSVIGILPRELVAGHSRWIRWTTIHTARGWTALVVVTKCDVLGRKLHKICGSKVEKEYRVIYFTRDTKYGQLRMQMLSRSCLLVKQHMVMHTVAEECVKCGVANRDGSEILGDVVYLWFV